MFLKTYIGFSGQSCWISLCIQHSKGLCKISYFFFLVFAFINRRPSKNKNYVDMILVFFDSFGWHLGWIFCNFMKLNSHIVDISLTSNAPHLVKVVFGWSLEQDVFFRMYFSVGIWNLHGHGWGINKKKLRIMRRGTYNNSVYVELQMLCPIIEAIRSSYNVADMWEKTWNKEQLIQCICFP